MALSLWVRGVQDIGELVCGEFLPEHGILLEKQDKGYYRLFSNMQLQFIP
jgi:hypothetical protein